MGQVISLLKIFTHSHIVELCGIILEVIQDGHNSTFLVVWKQRSKADVFQSDVTVQTVTPHYQILNSQLQIKHLHNTSLSQTHTITTTENKLIIYNNNIEPIAVETLGVFNASAIRLLNDLCRRISSPERLVICISEFRCWYRVSMLFCYTTACRSLTARTEHHTLSVIFINF